VYGTAGVLITPVSPFTVLPGLTQTIIVPNNSVLYISSDGGAQTTSSATNGFSLVDVALFVDGSLRANADYRRLVIANSTGIVNVFVNWSFSDSLALPPGSHTILVAAAGTAILTGSANATVSGGPGSVLQGQLSIVVVNR
jgi:hypothetical protein